MPPVSPSPHSGGGIGHAGQFTPGTEHMLSYDEKHLLTAILCASGEVITATTPDGAVTVWNDAGEKLLGYSAAEVLGSHISTIIPASGEEGALASILRAHDPRTPEIRETECVARDGRRVEVALKRACIRDSDGTPLGALHIVQDLSHRRAWIQEIESVRKYVRKLERSNEDLDDCAAVASHDLKEPLRGLMFQVAMLKEDYQSRLDPAGLERLDRMMTLARRMNQLIDDLLYFAQLTHADLAVKPTDVDAVVDDVRAILAPLLAECNARILTPHPLPRVVCDRQKVAEVFRNLVTNAVKYNDNPERLVEIGYHEELVTPGGPEKGVFYVKDNGVGISPAHHEDIFAMFQRLPVACAPTGARGTGIGLTFVKKIIERCGGRIWLDSAPEQGTTFYFTLA